LTFVFYVTIKMGILKGSNDVFDVMCGVEIHSVIIKIYVMSYIYRIKESTFDNDRYL
jgi:hypothetical protein